jgi:hypothetical protein
MEMLKIYIMDLQGLRLGVDKRLEINLPFNKGEIQTDIENFLKIQTNICRSKVSHSVIIVNEIILNGEKLFDTISQKEIHNIIYPLQFGYIFDKNNFYNFLNNLNDISMIKIMKKYEAREISYKDIKNEIDKL